jgi:hypothetical protein
MRSAKPKTQTGGKKENSPTPNRTGPTSLLCHKGLDGLVELDGDMGEAKAAEMGSGMV